MNLYKGNKPCPGCRKTAAESPRHRAAEVCLECHRLLELGKGVKNSTTGFSQVKLSQSLTRAVYITDLREQQCQAPMRLSGFGYISDTDGQPGSSRHLSEALQHLLETLDDGTKDTYDFKINFKESSSTTYSIHTLPALSLIELLDAMRLYGNRREAEGFECGHRLLVRLGNGSLSIDDFNRLSIGVGGPHTARRMAE